jgi:AcrR family transcriptional regulator
MSSRRLSRQDWTAAALGAIADQGLSGLAVEPLAKRLGATKGSFYWHFRDREELLRAALEQWEREGTDAVIATLGPVDDERARLRQLLEALFVPERTDVTSTEPGTASRHKSLDISITLSASPAQPLVAEVVARVTARRVTYLAELLGVIGIPPEEAQRRAVLVFAAYVGYSRLARGALSVPHGSAAQELVDSLMRMLVFDGDQPQP